MFEDGSATVADDTPLLAGVIDSLALMQRISLSTDRAWPGTSRREPRATAERQ